MLSKKLKDEYFYAIYKTSYIHITHYVCKILGDIELSKEIAQNSFAKLWEKGDFSEPKEVLTSFLFTIAYRESIDYIRREKRVSIYKKKILLDYISETNSLFDQYSAKNTKELIDKILVKMPDKTREIFILSRYKHLKNREIAHRLNISIKSVESSISKCIKEIREKI